MTVRLRAGHDRGRRATALGVLAALAATVLVAGGCGIGDDAPGSRDDVRPVRDEPLARPVPGVVEVAGTGGPWLDAAGRRADRGRPGLDLDIARTGEATAFRRLCAGGADVVHSTRPIASDELADCRSRGLEVVQLQVAAEAVVLAVGTTADVGVDCLTVEQLRSGLAAGSGVLTWAQLGGTELPLLLAGPGPASRTHQSLARALEARALRDDLHVRDASETRTFVAGFEPDRNLAARLSRLAARYDDLKRRVKAAWAVWGRATSPAARATARAGVEQVRVDLVPVERRYREATAARRRLDALAGRVGLFTQAEADAAADSLRPLAVGATGGECVLPSSATILDGRYPLARPLLLTATTRAWRRPVVRGFLAAVLGHAAQLADRSGSVPVGASLLRRQQAWLRPSGPPASAVLTSAGDGSDPGSDEPTPEVPVR